MKSWAPVGREFELDDPPQPNWSHVHGQTIPNPIQVENGARIDLNWKFHLTRALLVWSYNPGQNYVGQACRMHCFDNRSVFHMETNVLWAKSYLPPSPHAMLFVRKGLPTSRPTLHRGGRGERAKTAAIREKDTLSHTFWPGL